MGIAIKSTHSFYILYCFFSAERNLCELCTKSEPNPLTKGLKHDIIKVQKETLVTFNTNKEGFIMIYAYCRVSTPHQRLERQITNVTELYPKATIFREFYTGTTQNRPNWERLMAQIKKEDTIVFDSVSRMSRNAAEGFKDYKMLYELGVNLIFLNEPLINTSVFDSTRNNLLNINIETGNAAVDDFFKGNIELINNFMMALAEQQIKAAFEQSEKEVTDLHSRISQGMREAKKNGVKIGLPRGTTLTTKKALECMTIIKKHSKDFGGSLEDPDVIKLCGCSRNSYYKYKRELKVPSK